MRWILAVALSAVATAGPAAAQPAAPAPGPEQLKAAADQAFAGGDLLKALLFLEQAYALDPQPGLLANKALILERLGEHARSHDAFVAYLATDPPPEKRAVAEVAVDRLRPEVLIVSDPAGADVYLEGGTEPVGRTPLRLRVLAGSHLVRARLEGHREAQASLIAEPGRPGGVQLLLQPEMADGAEAPASRRTWGYVALGSGVAAGAVGGVLLGMARSAAADRDQADTRDAWIQRNGEAEDLATGSVAAFGVGLLGVGTGLYLLLSEP